MTRIRRLFLATFSLALLAGASHLAAEEGNWGNPGSCTLYDTYVYDDDTYNCERQTMQQSRCTYDCGLGFTVIKYLD